MVEPTMPVGATIAAFVMTIVSWYGMLRTGVQLVHDDNESRKSVDEDIGDMLVDLKHQENSVQDWNRKWCISIQTPNVILSQYWGAARLNLIEEKLKRITSDLDKARKKLGRLGEMKNHDWMHTSKFKRKYYTLSFIWTKKKYIQDLIERGPRNMNIIKDESDAGWLEQQQILAQEVAHLTPYHAQVAHLLVQIAMQNLEDVDALRSCCQFVKDDVTVFLDLDLFDAFAANTEYQQVERLVQASQVGHLKLDLLLREADRQEGELKRVIVERVFDAAATEPRIVDAFRAILSNLECRPCFTSDASTLFCFSKYRRAREPYSTLQKSLREVFANQDPPYYDAVTEKLSNQTTILGEISNARAAFELAQACLLFLRTSWIRELCHCTVRCGVPYNTSTAKSHQFGLALGETTHQPPLEPHPDLPERFVDGSPTHSWCKTNNHWYGLIKPIRHLGLLLIEVSLGTIVLPEINDDMDGSATVGQIHINIKAEPDSWKWETVSLSTILQLVKKSFNNSEHVAGAINYCMTGSFPSSLPDDQMKKQLRQFYFKVVKPLRDIYHVRLTSGPRLFQS